MSDKINIPHITNPVSTTHSKSNILYPSEFGDRIDLSMEAYSYNLLSYITLGFSI